MHASSLVHFAPLASTSSSAVERTHSCTQRPQAPEAVGLLSGDVTLLSVAMTGTPAAIVGDGYGEVLRYEGDMVERPGLCQKVQDGLGGHCAKAGVSSLFPRDRARRRTSARKGPSSADLARYLGVSPSVLGPWREKKERQTIGLMTTLHCDDQFV